MTEKIDDDAFRLLELDAWNRVVEGHARLDAGRALARTMRPAATLEEGRALLAETKEALALDDRGASPRLGVPADGLALVAHAREHGTPLLARELAVQFRFLRQARDLRATLAALDDLPALRALGRRIPDVGPLVRDLELAVDERGLLLDSATPRLRALRLEIAEKKEAVRQEIERIAKRPDVRTLLRSTHPTIRDGRFVLAVKIGSRGQVKGIYHDRSASGETAYVEPEAVVDEQAELRDLVHDEEREVGRILWEFTRRLLDLEDELVAATAALARFDAACARGAAARDLGLVEPELVESGSPLAIDEVRHPLLLAMARDRLGEEAAVEAVHAAVTPFSLRLGDAFDLLVVTGPNTGGKTVTLKAVGLVALLARCGSFVPAASGAVVPWFPGVFADVGDEQDLMQSLSTFSAHVRRIATVLSSAAPGALVLLDELGSGTDPLEGEALSTALLEHLLDRRLRGVVTTHLGRLKEFAGRNPRAANASMQFDPESLRPTYRLLLGIPGASNALKIARGLGLPDGVLVRAEELLSESGDTDRSRGLLDELDRSRAAVERL
ncbi:MAG: endonuclease MutS2, partial [Planctomycetota bacterium JB042]